MKKNSRMLVTVAESEGITNPRVIGGDPHARLVGEYKGKPFFMVCTISKGKSVDRPRGLQYTRANIRKVKRKIEGTTA